MNSLQNSINYNDTVWQIIQTMRSPSWNNRVFVLLEGQDDWRIYPKFFDGSRASLEYTGGKGQVLPSLQTLDRDGIIAIGICDADFQNLQNIAPSCPNLFFTDCHDIEMTMLKTVHILVNALTEYGLQKKANVILQDAMRETEFCAFTRWYSEYNTIGLKFKGLGLASFLRPDTTGTKLVLSAADYLNAVNKRTNNLKYPVKTTDVSNFMSIHPTNDKYNLCNGHDILQYISLTIWRIFKKTKRNHDLTSYIRVSYSLSDFHTTKLYASVATWQTTNHCCILL
jgi:hypothetical protein